MFSEDLEIIVITYNRRRYLEVTLNKLFSKGSPLKKYSITILDNNSNDGTEILCQSFVKKFSNLTYIKNQRNVGLAGNICKAMERASKKYYWIICDNDEIDFSSWSEVEKAMSEDYDIIMASVDYNCNNIKDKRAFVLAQSTFLPACIYKTQFLTDDIMTYAYTDIHTILPHVCAACNIINHNGRYYIPQKSIISLTDNVKIKNSNKYNYDRVITKNKKKIVHERTSIVSFYAGICASYNALEDKALRNDVLRVFMYEENANGYGPFLPVAKIYKHQLLPFYNQKMPRHIWCQFVNLIPFEDKIKTLYSCLFSPVKFFYSKKEGDLYIKFFGLIKTKLFRKVRGIKLFDFLVAKV